MLSMDTSAQETVPGQFIDIKAQTDKPIDPESHD